MKIFVGLLILVTAGISAQAQTQPQAQKLITELSASTESIVKNSPFSAEAVSESVQTLADGNRIVHSSTSKLYRNSEGRFRREMQNGTGGVAGSFFSYGSGIRILDPVVGYSYTLDPNLKTAEQALLKATTTLRVNGDTPLTEEQKVKIEKLKIQLKEATPRSATTLESAQAPMAVFSETGKGFAVAGSPIARTKYESKTEKLGTQNIEGVEAEGTRTTTTIPAGAIGNERPIEIVYEKWYSNDLQLVVMSKHNDPRSGEQTYRLTNIVRNEPDPSLFTLPAGYKVSTAPSAVYTIRAAKADAEKAATVRAAAAAAKPQL